MHRVYCPRAEVHQLLGTECVLSTHPTTFGTVTYLRCRCGSLVLASPGTAARHTSPPTPGRRPGLIDGQLGDRSGLHGAE